MKKKRSIPGIRIAARDRDLLDVLSNCVPIVDFRQIANNYHRSDASNARRSIQRLRKLGLVEQVICTARQSPVVSEPVVRWKPGELAPDPFRLAHNLTNRWRNQKISKRSCFMVGPRLRSIWGLNPRKVRPLQMSHELGFAEVYFALMPILKSLQFTWIGEVAFSSILSADVLRLINLKSQKPDAFLLDSTGKVVTAIEYGGVYNAKRLTKFHRWCQRNEVPYEIW